MSDLFRTVKAEVTARQAAEMYGLKVGRNGMTCCPFHQDKTPSMKVDERYYCFGCGVTGDAVDLTMQLLGLSAKDAALCLAADFGIDVREVKPVATHPYRARADPDKEMRVWAGHAWKVILDYRSLLRDWETNHAPLSMDDDLDDYPLFCEALQRKSYVDYLLDELSDCSKDQLQEFKKSCGKEIEKIGNRLERYVRRGSAEDLGDPAVDAGPVKERRTPSDKAELRESAAGGSADGWRNLSEPVKRSEGHS